MLPPDDATQTPPPPDARGGAVPNPPGSATPATAVTLVQGPPGHSSAPDGAPVAPGYSIGREVARGGMGAVYAARDPVLDREVAVKVMHPGQDPGRFVVEAKVTAQLPHPGVPPVHALGALTDGRPFLAMKFVHGRTLAEELEATGAADPSRLVGAFEQICQTIGFAHSRGIVHRDLKPSNVMVGAFGEVLVMDWGLAKELGGEDDPSATSRRRASTVAETVAGAVKGTPSYMAPEQARGEPVDARADVFALGGILAAILTGRPPFLGHTVADTVHRAARAELGDCFARLDSCAADPELVAVTKRCLAAAPADRFADAREVAGAVSAYRAGVEERLRRAERDRAVSAAEARGQRVKRKVQLALAATLLAFAAAGWYADRRAGRADAEHRESEARLAGERDAEARNKAEQARAGTRAALALAADLRSQFKFAPAGAALAQAEGLAAGGAPDLLPAVERARADLAFAAELDDIRYRKWAFVVGPGGGAFDIRSAAPRYRAAFAARGVDLTALAPTDSAARLTASDIKGELVAAVDDWALFEPDEALRIRLLEVARRADPGAWGDRLRDPAVWRDKDALAALASDTDPTAVPPAALSVLAELMRRARLDPVPLHTAARNRHPGNFELAFTLGLWLDFRKDGRKLGLFAAASALRPDGPTVWNLLGIALSDAGDAGGAAAAYREAVRRDPAFVPAHYNLGNLLFDTLGDADGAMAAWDTVLRLDPGFALAHYDRGRVLHGRRDYAGALAAAEAAVKFAPGLAPAHNNVGAARAALGDVPGALAAHRESLRLDPAYTTARLNVGAILLTRGELDDAACEFRAAARHDPGSAVAYTNLGIIALREERWASAAELARAALAADPKLAHAHAVLGDALRAEGDVPGARAAYARAVELDPRRWALLPLRLPPLPVAPPPRTAGR